VITPYVFLAAGWGLYFFLHSLLVASSVKEFIKGSLGLGQRAQRLAYSFISTVGVLALLFYNGLLGGRKLLPETDIMQFLSLFLAAGGVLMVRAAFKSYSLSSFLGLQEEKQGSFQSSGILAYVRHPLYTATILIVLGFFVYDSRPATLLSMLCTFIYLPIGIYLEEKKLVKEFGDTYLKYRRNVPMLIPSFKRRGTGLD